MPRGRSISTSSSSSRSSSHSRSLSRSLSRSSTAGPHRRTGTRERPRARSLSRARSHSRSRSHRRFHPPKPSLKTAAIAVAALAVAAICVHRFWSRRAAIREKERWDHSPPRRRLRRRNVIRDRHNGYIDDCERSTRRRLPEREFYPPARSRGESRYYESDGDSYYSDSYCHSPTGRRFSERRERIDDRRARRLAEEDVAAFGGPRDEIVRYEKPLTAGSEAQSGRFFDDDRRYRRRYGDILDDWDRRGERAFPSPTIEPRLEPVFDDRRSRRRSHLGEIH
ncbi:hypothetical protein CMUS01_04976 [Colletotrichum musicola]|uniref:Uncharacterized protein n=1 Tax=Colletotrichum musicola TaxID=2175873 RepID=A0A8H6KV83_9PEZI|nr:hypothetical protein CMUS01_04976 [Colletotrichum musicola]